MTKNRQLKRNNHLDSVKNIRKITILFLLLSPLSFFPLTAQPHHLAPAKDWKLPNNSLPNNAKAAGDWWQPDTLYCYAPYSEQPNNREIYSYNAQGCVTVQLSQIWEDANWKNDYKTTLTYDAQHNLRTELLQYWYENCWNNNNLYTYTYDAQNNLRTKLYQGWQDDNWKSTYKDTMTYDAQNNMLTDLFQFWQDENWKNHKKNTYSYDAQNNMLTDLLQYRHNENWQNTHKDTMTYDAQNKMLTKLFQCWQDENWMNIGINSYTYDAQNNLRIDLYKGWGDEGWENRYRCIYTYDAQNNRLTELLQGWNGEHWMNDSQRMWTYDENNNTTAVSYWMINWFDQQWQEEKNSLNLYYNNMQSSIFYYYDDIHKITAHYIKVSHPTAVAELPAKASVQVYPNPTSGELYVVTRDNRDSRDEIEIFDIMGRKQCHASRVTRHETGETVINISHLSAGVYFLRIGGETVKVVKQ